MKINLAKKTILLIFAFALADFLVVSFLFLPALDRIKESSQAISLAKTRLAEAKSGIAVIEQGAQKYQFRLGEIKNIENVFLSPTAPVEFISFLEGLSLKNNLTIEISPLAEAAAKNKKQIEPLPALSFNVVVKGMPTDCLVFLNELENSPYLLEIKETRMEKEAKPYSSGEEREAGKVNQMLNVRVLTK